MPYDAVLDSHSAVLVAEVLEEVRHIRGSTVNNGAAVVGIAVLVLVKALLKTEKNKNISIFVRNKANFKVVGLNIQNYGC
jgi:hypothetical protein